MNKQCISTRIDQLIYARHREWSSLFGHDKYKLSTLILAEVAAHEADLEHEVEELKKEKARRIYYQDIVYKVCSMIDAAQGNHISKGTGVVCGTLETPSTEVQEQLAKLLSRLRNVPAAESENKNG